MNFGRLLSRANKFLTTAILVAISLHSIPSRCSIILSLTTSDLVSPKVHLPFRGSE
jgi:hypothetical protein